MSFTQDKLGGLAAISKCTLHVRYTSARELARRWIQNKARINEIVIESDFGHRFFLQSRTCRIFKLF